MNNYKKYIVTFIDIMGFSHLIEKRYKGDAAPIIKIIDELVSTNQVCSRLITTGGLVKEVNYSAFSDSIVRRICIEGKPDDHIMKTLDFEILQLAMLQTYLIGIGVFIRGCIHIGQLYSRKGVFFGDAFNEAYKYESDVAVNPLIVLSDFLYEYLKSRSDLHRFEILSFFRNPEMLFNHSQPYINYLYMIESNTLIDGIDEIVIFMRAHKKFIEENIILHAKEIRVLMKYLWLKEYHNRYATRLSEITKACDLFIL